MAVGGDLVYQYRLATAADLSWLDRAALAGALEFPYEGAWAGLGPLQMAERAWQRNRAALGQGGGLIALAAGQPIGYALLSTGFDGSTEEIQGYLLDWWVDPPHRRRGVGGTLLQLGEALLASQGVRKMKVVMPLDRRDSLQRAGRSGFRPEGVLGIKNLT